MDAAKPEPGTHTPSGTLVCPVGVIGRAGRGQCPEVDGAAQCDEDRGQTETGSASLGVLRARAAERLGSVLRDTYRLDEVLGIGGMAAVFGATHVRNGHQVALKVLHRELADRPTLRSQFLREGFATSSVNHTGTVRVLDDGTTEDGMPFLVMERLEGETLAARRAKLGGRIGIQEATQILDRVLDVLASAHERGTVHRDIKPDNVFLTRGGEVKVLDFGIALLRDEHMHSSRTCSRW